MAAYKKKLYLGVAMAITLALGCPLLYMSPRASLLRYGPGSSHGSLISELPGQDPQEYSKAERAERMASAVSVMATGQSTAKHQHRSMLGWDSGMAGLETMSDIGHDRGRGETDDSRERPAEGNAAYFAEKDGARAERQSAKSAQEESIWKVAIPPVQQNSAEFPVEYPELLDEDLAAIFMKPNELPRATPTPEMLEEERIYRQMTQKEKQEAYKQYRGRKQLMFDHFRQVQHMESAEWSAAFAAKMQRLKTGPLTRGIVIPAGGNALLNNTWMTVKVLREALDCTLPIEIIYAGPEDMTADIAARFQAAFSDVFCIDASSIKAPGKHAAADRIAYTNGWQHNMAAGYIHKVFALCYATSFDEVLLMDGDNLPLRNPEALFNSPQFRLHGNLFWPDFWTGVIGHNPDWLRPSAYRLFELKPPWLDDPDAFATTETGQILINRLRHADVLEWMWFLNDHHEVMYKTFWGDTGAPLLAFTLAKKPAEFMQIAKRPAAALDSRGDHHIFTGLVQHDAFGRACFMHRVGDFKFEPTRSDFRHFDTLTVPLTPQRALAFAKSGIRGGGYLRTQIDKETYRGCRVRDERLFIDICNVDVSSEDLPIPALPVAALSSIASVVATSNSILASLQSGTQPSTWYVTS